MKSLNVVAIASYVPSRVVANAELSALTGRPAEWFARVTGIHERRRAAPGESGNDMAIQAVRAMADRHAQQLRSVDLVIGCTYTPQDTIGTLAHVIQRELKLDAPCAFTLSSACSSMVNGLELAVAMIESGRATTALVVGAEHNSRYARDDDDRAGHLWGDGAACILLTGNSVASRAYTLVDVLTQGRAMLGHGPDAITLTGPDNEIRMPDGRAVFSAACREIDRISRTVLTRNGLSVGDLALVSAHQANSRIIEHVALSLGLPNERMAVTIDRYGNTGCPSAFITLAEYTPRLQAGDWVLVPVFGGGYSVGAALLRRA